jgi:eukaryotic-like serine/threonine-protein kinase
VNCPYCDKPVGEFDVVCPHCQGDLVNGDTIDPGAAPRIVRLDPGDVVDGKWRLDRKLGQGGMGTVWVGLDEALDRPVAIKILAPQFCNDSELVERFIREAKLNARLEHPNIVPVHAVGNHGGQPFIVMSLLEGETLFQRMKRAPKGIPLSEALGYMRQFCAGLGFIHAKGFVHRDIKPGNLFLGKDGRAWILDFGVLRDIGTSKGMTRTGILVGTPQYMAPEQARAKKVDHRADLYALGLVLFEMVTGTRPFGAAKGPMALQMHLDAPIPNATARAPWVPQAVSDVIRRSLEKKPSARYQSADEFLEALVEAIEGPLEDTVPQDHVHPVVAKPRPGSGEAAPAGKPAVDPSVDQGATLSMPPGMIEEMLSKRSRQAKEPASPAVPAADLSSDQGRTLSVTPAVIQEILSRPSPRPPNPIVGASSTESPSAIRRKAATPLRKKKVLVVDDSDVALEAARIALEEAGYDVTTLDNPLVLVTTVRDVQPDLIILDISMPALPGDELVSIVGRHQNMANTPVVLHSDLPADVLQARAKACGAAGSIAKTADADFFVEQVRRWLR